MQFDKAWALCNLKENHISPIVEIVLRNIEDYCKFPQKAILLWNGCSRCAGKEKHKYPDQLKKSIKQTGLVYDARSNGPAIISYLYAGGERPMRKGSPHGWSIHHLYNGKFPLEGTYQPIHAVKNPCHFTQSAGLVAIHPVADALFEEYWPFAWHIRYLSYKKFNYDPEGIFSGNKQNLFGFTKNTTPKIICD